MSLHRESINNIIGQDLLSRNENWLMLDTHKERIEQLENWLQQKNQDLVAKAYRTDIISKQEISEARQGEESLHNNLQKIEGRIQQDTYIRQIRLAELTKERRHLEETTNSLNPNQESRQEVHGKDLISLPKNASEGNGVLHMQGFTMTNITTNGNFEESGGWSDGAAGSGINNNRYEWSKMPGHYAYAYQNVPSAEGDILYLVGDAYIEEFDPSGDNSMAFSLSDKDSFSSIQRVSTNGNQTFQKLTRISIWYTAKSNGTRVGLSNIRNKGYHDNVSVINLTQTFGEGNEPSRAWCDEHIINYIHGTESVLLPKRIRSIGKNLFDGRYLPGYYNGQGLIVNNDIRMRTSLIRVVSEKEYFVKVENNYLAHFVIYDKRKNFLRGSYLGREGAITLNKNEHYIGIRFEADETDRDTKLFVGLVDDYTGSTELTKESNLYINNDVELRSLPNGVKDEIRPNNKGRYELLKRVGEAEIKNVWGFAESENFNYIRFNKPTDFVAYGKISTQPGIVSGIGRGASVVSDFGAESDYKRINSTYILNAFTYGDDAFSNEEEAKELLVGKKYRYQLAEPEIIQLNTSGTLTTYPSGTIYLENIIADAGMYTTQFEGIYPQTIKEIETIYKVDSLTGEEIILDVSKAVVAGNTFTHPDLNEWDIVFVEYEYIAGQLLSNNSIEYYDSRYTVKAENTETYYNWHIRAADGVPSIELEELN